MEEISQLEESLDELGKEWHKNAVSIIYAMDAEKKWAEAANFSALSGAAISAAAVAYETNNTIKSFQSYPIIKQGIEVKEIPKRVAEFTYRNRFAFEGIGVAIGVSLFCALLYGGTRWKRNKHSKEIGLGKTKQAAIEEDINWTRTEIENHPKYQNKIEELFEQLC